MNPSYTIFHKDTETFSDLWSEYSDNYEIFCENYKNDLMNFGNIHKISPKPNLPENSFSISMIPWTTFEGFNININKFDYLVPFFTMGKYKVENGRYLLPFSARVHHAICDGFHLCRFLNKLQELINNI